MKNQSSIREFLFIGLTDSENLRIPLFLIFLFIYTLTLIGNLAILLVIRADEHLHTPMYFLLGNVSFLDVCSATVTVPKMLDNLITNKNSISFPGCIAQLYSVAVGLSVVCFLLAAMSYDRYAAICKPLYYSVLMNHRVCIRLSAGSWAGGFLHATIHTTYLFSLPCCGNNKVQHVLCEIPALLTLACVDTLSNVALLLTLAGIISVGSFLFIIGTYVYIVSAILKIDSAKGRRKTFSTCASHLTVVSILYGSGFCVYIKLPSVQPLNRDKVSSVLYIVVTPLLNPIIYTLRNSEVKGALRKLIQRKKY